MENKVTTHESEETEDSGAEEAETKDAKCEVTPGANKERRSADRLKPLSGRAGAAARARCQMSKIVRCQALEVASEFSILE